METGKFPESPGPASLACAAEDNQAENVSLTATDALQQVCSCVYTHTDTNRYVCICIHMHTWKQFILNLCTCVRCCEFMCTMCMKEPTEVRRGRWIPWNWSYRLLWAVMWVLGTKFRAFARAVSDLNCWVISLAPQDKKTKNNYILFTLTFEDRQMAHLCCLGSGTWKKNNAFEMGIKPGSGGTRLLSQQLGGRGRRIPVSSSSAWSTNRVPGHPGLQRNSVSKEQKRHECKWRY